MIRIFYGEDRVKARKTAEEILGVGYEVLEGNEINIADMPSIFLGASLLASKRAILIKDLGDNKAAFEKVVDFLVTPHEVVLLESKLDKRTAVYKELKNKIEIKEFTLPKNMDFNAVFDIYNVAKRDGKKAVTMLEKIEDTQDPYMFFGLLVSQAVKDFSYKQGAKEKRALIELSKLDILMKTTSTQPFLLLKSFLLQVSLF